MAELSQEAKEVRAAYKRKWYRENKDKQREYERRYWEKKTDSHRKKSEENGSKGANDCVICKTAQGT